MTTIHAHLSVYVKPHAKRSAAIKMEAGVLHVALHAKPKDNEANEELIRFLAEFLHIPKSEITLVKGKTSRHKVLRVPASVLPIAI